ncbi:MAG: signal peptidase I [Vulcanimicrobiaceae bacterium]
MTPLELFGLICVLTVVRVVMSLRPVTANSAASLQTTGDASALAPSPSPSIAVVVKEYLDAFIVAGLVALFLITFVVRTFFIPSGSMEPTLQIHDVLLVNEFEYRLAKPHDGDIVVFPPPIPTTNDFIKRLIGSPGETLRVHNGVVYRNGKALDERYIAQKPAYELEIRNYGVYVDGIALDPAQANIPPRERWTAPNAIPAGCYFMMGDNRNNSEDSHIWGFAQLGGTFATGPEAGHKAGFTGHAFLNFWPPGRLGILK